MNARISFLFALGPREGIFSMNIKTDAIYHVSSLFFVALIFFPLKRSRLLVLLFLLPPLIETAQFFVPGRVPDVMDAFHGYVGILLAYCLIQLWQELLPAVRKLRLHLQRQ
jgi:VanZ family protein